MPGNANTAKRADVIAQTSQPLPIALEDAASRNTETAIHIAYAATQPRKSFHAGCSRRSPNKRRKGRLASVEAMPKFSTIACAVFIATSKASVGMQTGQEHVHAKECKQCD